MGGRIVEEFTYLKKSKCCKLRKHKNILHLDDDDIQTIINKYECERLTQEQIDAEFSGEVF